MDMKNIDLSAEPGETKRATQEKMSIIPLRWHKKKDGNIFPVEITVNVINYHGKEVHIAAIRDITKRKQAEDERNKLQAQLSNAIEMAHLGPWEYDVNTDTFTFNDHFYKVFRTTAEEVGGYKMRTEEYTKRFLYPDDIPRVGEETKKALETKDPDYRVRTEHRIIFPDGTIGHMSVQIFIVKDEDGKTIKTYGVNQDITELKQAVEEREELIKNLEKALSEVKTLGGLLPICSHCKKIRDDKGYWKQIESYISEHSEAEFSHSICKECADIYYPDIGLYDDK